MSTAIAKPIAWIKEETTIATIADIAPSDFDAKRFVQAVATSVNKTPALAQCSPNSFKACALECAQLGLMPGAAGHVYLIPRKAKGGGQECTMQTGYKGLLHAVRKAVPGIFIDAQHVYDGDTCDLVIGERPSHRLSLTGRGKSLGVYATACEPGSDHWHTVWMPRDELEEHRKQYGGGGNYGPWNTATAEMERKTVLRRLCKTLPNMPLVDQMLDAEESAIDFDDPPAQVIDVTGKSEFGLKLIARIDSLGNVDRADKARAAIVGLVESGATDDDIQRAAAQILNWIEEQEAKPSREVVIDAESTTGGA